MAYFYRLVILVLVFVATPAFASFPASMTSTPERNAAFQEQINAGAQNCSYGFTVYCRSVGPCTATAQAGQMCLFDGNGGAIDSGPGVLSCPSMSTLAGSTCTCTAPAVDNAAGNACEAPPPPPPPPNPCAAGQPVTSAIGTGWAKKGDLVTVYAAQKALQDSPGCAAVSGNGCSVGFTGSNAAPIGVPGSNGYSSYTVFLKGSTTGEACTVPPPSPIQPEPPCAGQSGQLDGKTVCLAPESPSAAAARIASAAQAAAQAASIAASNAGATAAAAAAAAQAAGAAMAAQLSAGATPEAATAAAVAAGAAASAASTAGKTDGQVTSESTGAGSVAAAEMRARLIATSSGASAGVISQAVSSAGAAAAIAAAGVLANGGTQAQAAAAGLIAGQTATASVLVGSTPGAAAAAGAAAGSGAAAGQAAAPGAPNGSGKPDDPVGDFCKTNPQAKMCKTELDGEFSGVCGAPPICKGDAVMCAVAAATFATNCALRDPKVATPLYDAALLKTGDQTVALAGNSTVSVNSTQFDQTELLGAAVGMTDRSISVMGSTVVLPFSNVNIWLARLGVVLQAVTFLLCARIVTRG